MLMLASIDLLRGGFGKGTDDDDAKKLAAHDNCDLSHRHSCISSNLLSIYLRSSQFRNLLDIQLLTIILYINDGESYL